MADAKTLVTELFYDNDWRAAPVYTRADVTISRERAEQSDPMASTATFTIDNRDGQYDPSNAQSPLFGKIGRNTPVRLRQATVDQVVSDPFDRTSVDSWGSTPTGQAYSLVTVGGAAADFDVAAGVGTQVVDGALEFRLAWLPVVQVVDGDALLGPVDLPTAAVTGGSLEPGNIAVRMTDIATYYLFRVEYTTAEALHAQIYNPAGTQLVNNQAYSGAQWTPGEDIMVRAEWFGPTFRMRVWPASVTEPTVWHATAIDTSYGGPGGVGVRSGAAALNTNVPATFGYHAFVVRAGIRFSGEVVSWKPRRAIKGDAWVELEVAGVLRRAGQGSPSAYSALRRATLASSPAIYWPGEDGQQSTQVASGLSGGTSLIVDPRIAFADLDGPAGTDRLMNLAPTVVTSLGSVIGRWSGQAGTGTDFEVSTVFKLGGMVGSGDLVVSWNTGADLAQQWDLFIGNVQAALRVGGAAGTVIMNFVTNDLDDSQWHHIRVTAAYAGGNRTAELFIDGVSRDTDVRAGTGGNGFTAFGLRSADTDGSFAVQGFGHLTGWAPRPVTTPPYTAVNGFPGEVAATRMGRLCAEESIALRVNGLATDTAPMGPQPIATFVDLLAECARTDGGLLWETHTALGLTYRTRRDLYRRSNILTLNFTAGHVVPLLHPDLDDQRVRNDVTIKNRNGSWARAVLESGSLSVLPPPVGIGRAPAVIDVNLFNDGDLAQHAGWRLHQGTIVKTRYPQVTVDFDAPSLTPALAVVATRDDIGDTITIDNLNPDQVVLVVVGGTETFSGGAWRTIAYETVPADLFTVGVLDSGRLDTAGCALDTAEDTVSTAWNLHTSTGPLWSTVDEPYDLVAAGERVTVTAVASAVTDTFTRSVSNGWGTADSGQAWTTVGGSASDYSVDGARGVVLLPTGVTASRTVLLPDSYADVDIRATVRVSAVATGAPLVPQIRFRHVDSDNYYRLFLSCDTAGNVDPSIQKVVAAAATTLASASNVVTYSAGSDFFVRVQAFGSTLRAKVWTGGLEPDAWTLTVTDTTYTSGQVGCRSAQSTGNTNTNPTISYDNFEVTNPQGVTVTRSVNGVVKVQLAGAPVRLFAPFRLAL